VSILTTTTRNNSDVGDVVRILETQRSHSLDVIAPAETLRFKDGNLILSGLDPVLLDDGVAEVNGTYVPTEVADEGISEKLNIPIAYLRRMRAERPDLFDANVNAWLRGKSITRPTGREVIHEADSRSFLVRAFRGDDGGNGIMRALQSDRYKVMDSLDALLALMKGVTDAGVHVLPEIDLTPRRMIVRMVAPEVTAYADTLLERYRSPFNGRTGKECPTVFAGLVFSNSEVGNGAWSLQPRITFEVCDNGMTITKDIDRQVHLGGVQSEGVVQWSEETNRKALELVTSKTTDAVKTFLDVDYMVKVIADLEGKAIKPVAGSEAPKVIKGVSATLGFNKTEQAGILDAFLNSGDMSAGGIMQAVTAFAQDASVDADRRLEFEAKAGRVLDLV
jgi:hypothetical protein